MTIEAWRRVLENLSSFSKLSSVTKKHRELYWYLKSQSHCNVKLKYLLDRKTLIYQTSDFKKYHEMNRRLLPLEQSDTKIKLSEEWQWQHSHDWKKTLLREYQHTQLHAINTLPRCLWVPAPHCKQLRNTSHKQTIPHSLLPISILATHHRYEMYVQSVVSTLRYLSPISSLVANLTPSWCDDQGTRDYWVSVHDKILCIPREWKFNQHEIRHGRMWRTKEVLTNYEHSNSDFGAATSSTGVGRTKRYSSCQVDRVLQGFEVPLFFIGYIHAKTPSRKWFPVKSNNSKPKPKSTSSLDSQRHVNLNLNQKDFVANLPSLKSTD
jgi:hypothetical protein